MTELPRAGVVVPNRDRCATLRVALEALQRQTVRDHLTVVVVDNGSVDDSLDVAEQFADIVVRESAPGSHAARNAGIAILDTAYALTLDSDCRPADACWAARHLAAIHASPADVFAVAGPLLPEPDSDWWSQRADITPHPAFAGDGTPLYAVGGNGSLKLSLFRELGGFPAVGADDYVLGRMAREHGLRVVWHPDAAVYHRNPCGARGYFSQMHKVGRDVAELTPPPAVLRARLALEFARATWVASKGLARGGS